MMFNIIVMLVDKKAFYPKKFAIYVPKIHISEKFFSFFGKIWKKWLQNWEWEYILKK